MTESSDISTIFAPTPGEETQVFFRSEDTTPAGDTTRQAQTAALAELTSAPEDVDFFELYRSRYQLLDRQLRAGMAKNIYEKNRAERLRNAVSMAPFIQQDTNFYAQSSAIIADLLEQERSESQPTQKNATQNVFALQNLDPEEARLLERAYQLPNFLEQRIETDARMAMLQEVVARETAMRGDAPLLKTILDYALFMLPFQNSIGATGNVETDRVTNDFYSNVISGGAQFQETAAFWQMSPDEFTEEFLVDTLNNFKQSATILGYNNRVLETALIGELMMGVDPTFKSALDVIDNGPLFLFGALKAGKALGLVKTLARSGSRSSSAETLSRLLSVVENEGETALRKTTGETVDDVIDSTLPSVVNPDLGSSVINVGAEATRRYDTGRQLIDVLEIQRPLLSRLSRDELSAAIEAQLKNIRGQFGDKRVLNVSTRTRTDSSGIESPVLVVEMGTAKGGRFANLNNLTRFLRGQGYDPQYVNKIGSDSPRPPRKPRPVFLRKTKVTYEAPPKRIEELRAEGFDVDSAETLYHGTAEDFDVFSTSLAGKNFIDDAGIFLTSNIGVAKAYAQSDINQKIYEVVIRKGKVYNVDAKGEDVDTFWYNFASRQEILETAKAQNANSILVENVFGEKMWIIFDAKDAQIVKKTHLGLDEIMHEHLYKKVINGTDEEILGHLILRHKKEAIKLKEFPESVPSGTLSKRDKYSFQARLNIVESDLQKLENNLLGLGSRKKSASPLPPSKDPVFTGYVANEITWVGSKYKINPSKETLNELVANSQFGEVKILVTKEGNKISLPDGMTHSDAIDELKIPSSDVGRSSYFLKKGETKPLTFKDTPFKTRMEEGVKPVSKLDQDLELLSGKIIKAEKDLEEVKQGYALVADLSGKARLDATRNLRQQERALKKDIRRFKDQRADLEASRTQADPVKADISPAPEGTGWTAEIEFPIEEAGFYAPITDVKSNWGIGRFVLGGRQLSSEDLFGLAVMSASRRNSLISTINKNIVPLFRALKKREQRALSDIIQVGERQGKWLTRREIDVMYNDRFNLTDGVTPKRFYDAYSAYKALNDLEYTLRNDELFSLMNAKGFQTVSIEIPEGFFMSARNAKVERSLPARLPEGRTYNATKGFHYLDDDLRRYNPKELEEQGYVLVKLEGTMAMPYQAGDIHISNVLVRKSEVSISPLANVQIPYRPGGHRMYSTKVRHFAKQASVMRQADTGEKFLGAAKTWKGATKKADLEDWVERHNLGIKVMREYRSAERTEEEAREALSDLVDNADDFWNDVEDGYITLDELFEVVGDRELPSAYARSPNAIVGDSGEGVPGYLSQVQTQGRMYYSPKGKPLTDPQGEELPTLDAFETVNRALGSVSNLIGFSTYKQRAMGKWVKTYGDYLDVAGKKSLSRQFVEGRFRRDTPATIVNAAEQQRQTIMRTLNWTSPEQMNAKSLTRNLVEYLESSNIVGTNQAASIVNWLDESDFTSKLRGYIFDAKLGLFNVAQFPMQITTMLAATSIDPKKGMQAMYATPFLRVMNTKYNDMDSFAEAMKGRKFGFDSTEDFIDMATELRRGGFLDVNSSQVQINDMNLSTGFNLTGSIGTDARELGRTFFYEAERWNRTTAWQMAWRRVKERTPNLDRQTFLERVFQEAEDLSLNMSEASSAAYQKGILSIPTQFWAYQNRVLEAAFGRQFTVQEKIRLVAGQYILYGSIGIPVLAQASEYLKGKAGETPNLQEKPVQFVMDRGLIDTIISVVTGNDLAFSERAGIGHFHTDVIRELFGAGRYGDASTFEVLGGASASIFSDFAEDTSNLFKWMALEAGAGQPLGPVTRNQVENVFRNISTVNNSLKFYALWKYGTLESSSGTVLFSEGTKSDAIASLFGIPMGEVQDINAKVNWMRNRKKAVEDVAQILIDYRTKFAARYPQTGDIANEMYLFTQVIPDELLFDALERANRFTPDPVYESISRNVREKKAELEATK